MDPAGFSAGDVVEIQVTFEACYSKRDDRCRMFLVLRALTLIDDTFTKVTIY